MALTFRRRRPAPAPPPPRPDYTAIAVLEHDLFGIQPKPGTAAALAIALRQIAANCTAHEPVETTAFASPARTGLCRRCGRDMLQGGDGEWRTA